MKIIPAYLAPVWSTSTHPYGNGYVPDLIAQGFGDGEDAFACWGSLLDFEDDAAVFADRFQACDAAAMVNREVRHGIAVEGLWSHNELESELYRPECYDIENFVAFIAWTFVPHKDDYHETAG